MAAPLEIRGESFGALSFASAESGCVFDEDDLRVAEELARRAALAIEQSRLYAAELRARAEAERERQRAEQAPP